MATLQQQSLVQGNDAVQTRVTDDTAHLMQRFGVRSAIAGTPMSLASPSGAQAMPMAGFMSAMMPLTMPSLAAKVA